ncbi:MAG: hypothetical protein ACPL1A_10010 [Candidatus Kapaibacteriota bacterium]
MKIIKIILTLFLLFILFSSEIICETSIHIKPFFPNNFNSQYLQSGESYFAEILLDSNLNKNINENNSYSVYLLIGFYSYNETRPLNIRIMNLKRLSNVDYFVTDTFSIPKYTNILFYSLHDNDYLLTNNEFLPIFNDEFKLNKGGAEYYLNISDSSTYMDNFTFERNFYPDNFNIFVLKWMKEGELHILNRDSIYHDLKLINDSCSLLPNLYIYNFIGYALLQEDSIKNQFLYKISEYKNIPVLNNYFIAEPFIELLNFGNDASEFQKDTLIQKIILNNPCSEFAEIFVKRGLLLNIFTTKNLENLIHFFEIKKDCGFLSYDDKLILLEYFIFKIPNKLDSASILSESLFKDLQNKNLFSEGKDPFHHLFLKKSILYNLASILYIKNKEYLKGIELQNKLLEIIEPFDLQYSYAYYYKGKFFSLLNQSDSAVKSLTISYKLNSHLSDAYNLLKSIYTNIKSNEFAPNFNNWVDSLLININIPEIPLPENTPLAKTDKGNVNLKDSSNLLLEFYTKNCSFCIENLKQLSKNLNKIRNYKILIVSDLPPNVLTQELEKLNLNYNYYIVINSDAFIKFFKVVSYPTSIIIKYSILKNKIIGGDLIKFF